MRTIVDSDECCGCSACSVICPKNAIEMARNEKGFWMPIISSDKCIDCGLCVNVCGVIETDAIKNDEGKAYGVINLDNNIRIMSTSGGAFSAFAERILSMNGVVYGAAFAEKTIKHIRVILKENLALLRGSKYAQSDISNVYHNILEDIKQDRKVIFSGTPCQCASVKKFLGVKKVNMENVFFIDMVCHGVCSTGVFEAYINYCEKRKKKEIVTHLFRSKVNGWSKHTEVNVYEDGEQDYSSYESQLFKSIFYSHVALRNSCFGCKFCTVNRVSDITMADFWGLQKSHPLFYDSEGVSFILTNTKKGQELLESSKDVLEFFEANICDTEQPQLYRPAAKVNNSERFWKYYQKGFRKAVVKCFHAGKIYRFSASTFRKCLKVITLGKRISNEQ